MCGIAGWFGPTDPNNEAVAAVQSCLQHRGPDARGVERIPHGGLIHTRLKIIDLTEAGHQPMVSANGSVWVVFNGEIYNHRDLRRELEAKGHSFRGHSDTEVIAPLYLEHGLRFAEHLRGMFAIGLVDVAHGRLVLVRDRFGIKPLHYAVTPDAVFFASEIGALRRFPGIDLRPDPQAVHDFLALHVVAAPHTVHRGIRTLEPGWMLEASLGHGDVDHRLARWHRWTIAPDAALTPDRAIEAARHSLDAGVARQLESDVPLGGLLSGGIDSSLVCAAAQRGLDGMLRTFGVRFDDPEFDESATIEVAAKELQTRHLMLDFTGAAASWDDLVAVLEAAGQPFADTSIFAVHALSRLVREHVTVALSGDGGDEGFGGYDHYARLGPLARSLRLPRMLRRGLFRTAAVAATPLGRLGVIGDHLAGRLADMTRVHGLPDLVADQTRWLRTREIERWWAGPPVEPINRLFEAQWDHVLPARASTLERAVALMTEVDTRVRLANDYLPKVDIASMQASLEVRVPLLDESLFAFALTLPARLKRSPSGESKVVLRALAQQQVPELASLPKHGFGVPVDTWVGDDFKARLRSDLLGPGSTLPAFLDPSAYRPVVEAFCTGSPLPGLTRQGLYQRAVMLLALDLSLGHAPSRAA